MITGRAGIGVLWLLLAGLALTVSAQENEPEADQGAPHAMERRATALTGLGEWSLARMFPERAVWLDLDDDSRALALFQPELKTPARGALIVLADEGQTAAEGLAGGLLDTLAERGVAVMTLGLRPPPESVVRRRQQRLVPEPQETAPPEDDQLQSSVMIDVAEEDALEEVMSDYRNSIRELLDAAAGELERRGYERPAVSGIGWSADYVTAWALGQGALSGVIWLAPRFSGDRLPELPAMLSADRPWRVLDLHAMDDAGRHPAVARAAALAREQVSGYRRQPMALSTPPQRADAERVASRIQAWMNR